MKLISLRVFLGFIAYFVFVLSISAETVSINTGNSPPYSAENSAHKGYLSHIISESFTAVGIETEFVFQPWARVYEDAKKGLFQASSYWYRHPRHNAHFLESNTITQDRIVFFRRKNSSPKVWSGLTEFTDLRMGVIRGFTYTEALWQYAEDNPKNVVILNTDLQAMKMLLLGRIDMFPSDEVSGWLLVQKNFAQEQQSRIETIEPELVTHTGHLMFPKLHPESERLREKFNQGLSIIKQNGTMEKLRNNLILGIYSEPQP